MKRSKSYGKTTAALACATLLCGSMGLAQMQQNAPAPPGGAGQGPGQNPSMDSQMNGMQIAGEPSPMDRMFVSKAMQGSMAEIQLGRLTLQKSDNPQVKQFAQQMIDDHSKLNEQMKPVAKQLGVSMPAKVSKKDSSMIAKLQELSGTAYDQAYIKDVVKDHKEDLSEFQMEASAGQDQMAKDAASQGSKLIAQHLQMAQQLAKDQGHSNAGQ